jgi:hypothetical protein
MDLTTFLWTTFGIYLTISIFSFLYKDNPFYKFAEHLFVGVSAGYFVIILWHGSLAPNLFNKIAEDNNYWYIIPGIAGLMMFTRFSKKYNWISRWPLAAYIGISAGVAIPLEMSARVNRQLYASMTDITWSSWDAFWGPGFLNTAAGYSDIIILLGSMSALIYFFFSKAHTGVFGGIAKFGLWILMIGFGTSFGFTVMARISLFINRIQSMENWRMASFNSANEHYSMVFPLVFYGMILLVLAYAVVQFMKFMKERTAAQ